MPSSLMVPVEVAERQSLTWGPRWAEWCSRIQMGIFICLAGFCRNPDQERLIQPPQVSYILKQKNVFNEECASSRIAEVKMKTLSENSNRPSAWNSSEDCRTSWYQGSVSGMLCSWSQCHYPVWLIAHHILLCYGPSTQARLSCQQLAEAVSTVKWPRREVEITIRIESIPSARKLSRWDHGLALSLTLIFSIIRRSCQSQSPSPKEGPLESPKDQVCTELNLN